MESAGMGRDTHATGANAAPLPEYSRAAVKQPERLDTVELANDQVNQFMAEQHDNTQTTRRSSNRDYSKNAYQRDCLALMIIFGKLSRKEPFHYNNEILKNNTRDVDMGLPRLSTD